MENSPPEHRICDHRNLKSCPRESARGSEDDLHPKESHRPEFTLSEPIPGQEQKREREKERGRTGDRSAGEQVLRGQCKGS